MKLLTKQLRAQIPKLNDTEGIPLGEKLVVAKFFHPASSWTWYAIEYDGEDTFWGLVDGHELEFGYFSLRELSTLVGRFQLSTERDKWFRPTRVKDLPVYDIERVAA